jgi:tRNA pseudouridine55 synthase
MATGVLILAVGEATKLVNQLTALSKVYETTLKLGRATDSLDADGITVEERDVPALALEAVRTAAERFQGEIEQQVPAVSAVKVDGQALYARARKGQDVVAPVRTVTLERIEVLALRADAIDLRLRCSKGFYVRSLGRDLACALGTVGHLSALRRTENGFFQVEGAVPFDELRTAARGDESLRAAVRARLVPLQQLVRQLHHVVLEEEGVRHARHGRLIPASSVITEQRGSWVYGPARVALDEAGNPIAIVEPSGEGFRVARGFSAT